MKRMAIVVNEDSRKNLVNTLRIIADEIESMAVDIEGANTLSGGWYTFDIVDVEYPKPEIKVDPNWQDEYDHTQNYEEVFG